MYIYIYIVKIFSFNNSVKIQFSKNVLSNGIKFNLNTILECNQRKKEKKRCRAKSIHRERCDNAEKALTLIGNPSFELM